MEMIGKSAPATASPFDALFGILVEPAATFARLAPHSGARRGTWLPVVALLAASAIVLAWYFLGFVDYAWLQERMLDAVADPAEREQAAKMAMSQQAMGLVSVIGAVVAMLAGFALYGLYFLVVAKIRNQDFGFRHGFALSAWASVPSLLLLPLGAMQILLSTDGRLPYEALNPTSLNQLLFHFEETHPLAGLLESLSIPAIWSIALLVIGYRAWTGSSRGTALRIVLPPHVVVYGAWLAYALSKSA